MKNNSYSCNKFNTNSEKVLKTNKNSNERTSISHERIKLNKMKSILINDKLRLSSKFNTSLNNQNNQNNSFIKTSTASNFFNMNNC
jgi:hypothetical protein